jgi:hypothetical protein
MAFWAHLKAYVDIFPELSDSESEFLILKFFGQFSICRDLEKQVLCNEIAEFLSTNLLLFSRHMLKQSMVSYDLDGARISGLLMALLNNNVPYWEFMHAYGISFADNRHIIYEGIAGNILQGVFILMKDLPHNYFDALIPFVQRLFRYLEEDGSTLKNMKTIAAVMTSDRKKIAAKSFFKKPSAKKSAESEMLLDHFKQGILAEPYGTIPMMDAIEAWLIRARKNWAFGVDREPRVAHLMPKLVELIVLVTPYISTETILKSFQRLLALQTLGMFDDQSCHQLLAKKDLPPLRLLSQFSLVYVGAEYQDPVNRLLDFFISVLSERGFAMSNSMLSHFMQSYFTESKSFIVPASSRKLIAQSAIHSTDEHAQSIIKVNQKLTLARMAFLLFTIKANREMFLEIDDYRVMLNFYQCYLGSEIIRFDKGDQEYNHQRRVCINVMEASAAAIEALELPSEVKTALFASPEYSGLMQAYHQLKQESGEDMPNPSKSRMGAL